MTNLNNNKGKQAEQLLAGLLSSKVFSHYVYLNPSDPAFRNGNELCDVLIVFKKKAVVLQVKNTKLSKESLYKSGDLKKNVKQSRGAARALLDGKRGIKLKNYAGITDKIDLSAIDKVYCVAVHHGEQPEFYGFYDDDKPQPVHIIDYGSFQLLINELGILPELFMYLDDKEGLFGRGKEFILTGGEQDLFALWIRGERSFSRYDKSDLVTVMEGIFDALLKDKQYQTKKREDAKYIATWDTLILSCVSLGENYKIISDELVDHNSLGRRMLGRALGEFLSIAIRNKDPNRRFTHYQLTPDTNPDKLYIYLFYGEGSTIEARERRGEIIKILTMIFLRKYGSTYSMIKKVIGVASDSVFTPTSQFEFMYAETSPEWIIQLQKNNELDEIAKLMGVLQDNLKLVSAQEYSDKVDIDTLSK